MFWIKNNYTAKGTIITDQIFSLRAIDESSRRLPNALAFTISNEEEKQSKKFE
jgi:hypothetical protein